MSQTLKKFALKDFTDAIDVILRDPTLKSVTLFCAPLSNVTQRVRVSRRIFSRGGASNELMVTFGKPNYAEREFLALCKKAKTKPHRFLLKFKPTTKKR